ncbi:MAG: hypothetical protein RI907_1117 [Pseudomonadota bacterium]|jgi:mannose-6-phosphate isomerase-like protein (cupin superfamily)
MNDFATMTLPGQPTVLAPDGSEVRVLLGLGAGGMAHFTLGPGQVAKAVAHHTVEEIWFVLSGRGQMWRKQGSRQETVDLVPGVCITIPVGTHFQFRAMADEPLTAVAITMPPWPGDGEAYFVEGPWSSNA